MKRIIQVLNLNLRSFSFLYFFVFIILQCDCFSIKSRIIGGRSAKSGQFPWQVLLKISKNRELRGGGSLISPLWVLTAAHCTYGLKQVYLKMGTNYLLDNSGVEMISNDIQIHPEYNDSNLQNDISLIKLPKSLKISAKMRPIFLVSYKHKNDDFIGRRAIISGYGFIDDKFSNPFSDLLYTKVNIISNAECKESYGDKVFPSTMCSIGSKHSTHSICDGDSGGPLVLRDWYGIYFQIGIISYSAKFSCSLNYPAAYTRLTFYLDYIRDTTKLDLQ